MTMLRNVQMPQAIAVLLLALVADVRGADAPEYAVSTEAVRTGEQISLSIKLAKSLTDGGAETLAAPRLLIQDGKRALVIVSTGPASAAAPAGAGAGAVAAAPPLPSPERATSRRTEQTVPAPAASASPEDLESGIRVDVISIKGKDKAIVLTTVVEKGETTWAESKTIDVTVGKTPSKP